MSGFGRRYWLQVLYVDGSEKWLSLNLSKADAIVKAANLMADRAIDVILLLDGRVKQGSTAKMNQIYGEFNRTSGKRITVHV